MSRCLIYMAVVALSVSYCQSTQAQQKSIVETAVGAGNFNTLVTAVKAAGLVDALSGSDQLTVFAPTDDAFAKLDPALLESLLKPENKAKLAAVLTYHVLKGRISAADAYDHRSAKSLNGQRLMIDFQAASPTIGGSNLVASDIGCTNGVIHVIDTVMIPSLDSIPVVATEAGTFNTLLAAVEAADLGEVLGGAGPFTVFAPTDDAFAVLPEGTVEGLLKPENKQKLIDLLKYHVLSGRAYDNNAVSGKSAPTLLGPSVMVTFSADGLMVNQSKVVAKNIDASNGVIHVIDKVLSPNTAVKGEQAMVGYDRDKAMSMIKTVIKEGVPVYNAGHHDKCGEMYQTTMDELLSKGIVGADEQMMTVISDTLNTADETEGDTDRAWVLRRGLDSVFTRLGEMP